MIDAAQFQHLLHLFARLLRYPRGQHRAAAGRLAARLSRYLPEASRALEAWLPFAREAPLAEQEEAFTRAFELTPLCALEIGWHLFGEEYARGMLLVRLRRELARHGIDESGELPDHLALVLRLLARMELPAASAFASACVLPALARMEVLLRQSQDPHAGLLTALRLLLEARFGLSTPAECFNPLVVVSPPGSEGTP